MADMFATSSSQPCLDGSDTSIASDTLQDNSLQLGERNKYQKVDLHSHSTCSDGTYTPDELLALAKQANIDVLALTDHDTLAGLEEAHVAAKEHGICLINGAEISCQHTLAGGYGKNHTKDKIIHIVALGFSEQMLMSDTLTQIQESRANRGRHIVAQLAVLLPIDEADFWQSVLLLAEGNPQAVGRAHIARVLHDKGYVKTVQQAFDKYLADNKPAYVAIETLSMQQTIELIHHCGGKAVLAHPTRYQLSATRVRKLIAEFAQLGGDACELPSQDEPVSKRQMVDRSIAEHQLAVSVGSDFHGSTMPWRRLGDVPKVGDNQTLITELLN